MHRCTLEMGTKIKATRNSITCSNANEKFILKTFFASNSIKIGAIERTIRPSKIFPCGISFYEMTCIFKCVWFVQLLLVAAVVVDDGVLWLVKPNFAEKEKKSNQIAIIRFFFLILHFPSMNCIGRNLCVCMAQFKKKHRN